VPWLIVTATVLVVFFLDKWENKNIQSLFDWVPAILLAYIIPAVLTALLGVDYSQSDIHNYSKLFFIPMAIVAVMSSLSFPQLKSIGWKPIVVFLVGSLWIAVFPIILILLIQESNLVSDLLVTQEYWKGLPPIVGSWIGGSTSQVVLKELINCPENIFLSILVLDNILVNIWTILMFQSIKKSNLLNRWLNISDLTMPEPIQRKDIKKINSLLCFFILILSVILTNLIIDQFVVKILLLSAVGLLLSNTLKTWNFEFALQIGSILILIVMAVLGLKLNFKAVHIDLSLLLFLIVWLVSHFIIMLIAAKILGVNSAWVPIASMANVGGIATAPAVTAAYEKKWMPHAIILAILSMATGTFWGMLTILLIQNLVL